MNFIMIESLNLKTCTTSDICLDFVRVQNGIENMKKFSQRKKTKNNFYKCMWKVLVGDSVLVHNNA